MTFTVEGDKLVTYGAFFITGLGAIIMGMKKYLPGMARAPRKVSVEYAGNERRHGSTLTIDNETVKEIVTTFQGWVRNHAEILNEIRGQKDMMEKLGNLEADQNKLMEKTLTGITLANQALSHILNLGVVAAKPNDPVKSI